MDDLDRVITRKNTDAAQSRMSERRLVASAKKKNITAAPAATDPAMFLCECRPRQAPARPASRSSAWCTAAWIRSDEAISPKKITTVTLRQNASERATPKASTASSIE